MSEFFSRTAPIQLLSAGLRNTSACTYVQTKKNQITLTSRQAIRQHSLRAGAVISNIDTDNRANLFSLDSAHYDARKRRVNAQDKNQKPPTKTSPALPADQALQHCQHCQQKRKGRMASRCHKRCFLKLTKKALLQI